MNELLTILRTEYDAGTIERIQTGYSHERPVSLRVNSLKSSREEVQSALEPFSCKEVEWYSDALIVEGVREDVLQKIPLYTEGKIYLQSLSSMIPPLYLQPQAGENILDMTAAPGGKTTELFALSGGKALICACERDKIRFERMKFNLERQGATRVNALQKDALLLDEFLKFDKILLDAPCSGSGTPTPSTPIRFSTSYLQKCVKMQEKLLKKALKLLKKGGTLIYSTCSILKEENDGLLARILPREGAKLVPIEPFTGIPTLPSTAGTITVLPTELYEGFFVAKITK